MKANEIIEQITKLELITDIQKVKEYCQKEIELRFKKYMEE